MAARAAFLFKTGTKHTAHLKKQLSDHQNVPASTDVSQSFFEGRVIVSQASCAFV